MKAVIAKERGGPEVLRLVDLDIPVLADGEVRINVKAFGLNKVDSCYRRGLFRSFVPGQILGIEAVGVVDKDLSGNFCPGQKVATVMGGMMLNRPGCYAEYVSVSAQNVIKIDSSLSFTQLAGIPMAYGTAWLALNKNLKIRRGQTLLVRNGTTSLGMAAISYAKGKGLKVLAATQDKNKIALIRELDVDKVLIDDENLHEQLIKLYPVSIDCCLEQKNSLTIADSMRCLKAWGGITVVDWLMGETTIRRSNLEQNLPPTIKYSYLSSEQLYCNKIPLSNSFLQWCVKKMEENKLYNPISDVFHIDEIIPAHALLDSDYADGKIVITI